MNRENTHTCSLMIGKRLNARRVSKVPDLNCCITAGCSQLYTTAQHKQLMLFTFILWLDFN